MPFMHKLFFLIYQLLVMPITVALAMTVGLLSQKIRTALGDRMRLRQTRRNLKSQPIWIHASSGEFEYAKSVIREFKQRHPQIPILVTYFSPSYKKQISQFPGVDQAEPLPLDLPGPVNDFLRFYNPRLALFSRTDLWPEALRQTKGRKIPSLLFSCTRPPLKGFRKLSAPFYGIFYSLLNDIYCVSAVDENNLHALTATPVKVSGDTRYDQVAFRLQQQRDFSSKLKPSSVPRLIAGSTWPQDEAVLLPALADLMKTRELDVILVPHEPTPDHLQQLEKQLKDLGIGSTRLSQAQDWEGQSVLLIDQMGILADLYPYADMAFIGGSFKAKVHSVMEALGAGLPVLVGPHHTNNREAVEFQTVPLGEIKAVQCVMDQATTQKTVQNILKISKNERGQIKSRLQAEFARRQGATNEILSWLETRL